MEALSLQDESGSSKLEWEIDNVVGKVCFLAFCSDSVKHQLIEFVLIEPKLAALC